MDLSELIIGHTYFQVTYPDPELTKPIIITYEYLGEEEYENEEGETETGYLFKYHPAFTYEDEGETRKLEKYPVSFSEEQAIGLSNMREMITELSEVVDRVRKKG